jgi:hypothetical protein
VRNRSPFPFSTGDERGQILVMAVLMMIALIGITGLAIDVSSAFMEQRWDRSVADAASLAGAQDLQKAGRLLPLSGDRDRARVHAMQVVTCQLQRVCTPPVSPVAPACLNIGGCALTGTPYRVSIYAGVDGTLPKPTCLSDCDSRRAVQVHVWQPSYGLSFSRVLGFSTWNVGSASVAGIVLARQVGVVTLRPPDPRGIPDSKQDDLFVTGGSKVIVGDSDVITNTNLVCSGSSSELDVEWDKGFAVYHFDPYEAWVSGSGKCLNPPPGVQITSPVDDPKYTIPDPLTDPKFVYTNEAQATGTDPGHLNFDPNYATRCLAQQALVPDAYRELKNNQRVNDPTQVRTVCLRPGVYRFKIDVKTPASGIQDAYLLEPGVYFLDYGVDVNSTLIGGYEASKPGVALVLLEAKNTSGTPGQMLTSSGTSTLALNFGNRYCPVPLVDPCPAGATWATPALGAAGPVQTLDPQGLGVPITVMVRPDPGCVVGPVAPPAASCKESENATLKLTGGGNIYLAGVQYAPSDNVNLKGNSGQASEVGAIWAWTIKFDSSVFNMATSNPQMIGNLRLVRACSPTEKCDP